METFLQILRGAIEAGASDIHIKPDAPVTFRIARELAAVEAPAPTHEWMEGVLAAILTPELRRRLQTEHEVDFAYAPAEIGRFRTNVFQQRGGHVLAMRVVKTAPPEITALNLPESVRKIAGAPRGIVLIAGAAGSGKSTTLAAMIEHINRTARRHILTLEDPIEFLFTDQQSVIEQREIGVDTATFATGLKNVLRQDPDVLVIGEMRDRDSVEAAISAANIGHLVISTLHTADAGRSVRRILGFFGSGDREQVQQQLSTTLEAVICQKLIPTTDGRLWPAVEVLINNGAVAKLIHEGQLEKLPGAIELGGGDGMQTFEQALHALAQAGKITQADALAHSPNAEALKMRFQGVILNETRRILGSRR